MSRMLFENKKVALGFAGAIVVVAALFSEASSGPSDADQVRGDSTQGFQSAAAKAASKSEEDIAEERSDGKIAFASDEELIDETSGFDTLPGDNDSDNGELAEGDGEAEDESEDNFDDSDRFDPYGGSDSDRDRRRDRDDDPFGFEDF